MKPERKKITLPSGATLVMRRVCPMDYVLTGCSDFPDFLRIASAKNTEIEIQNIAPDKRAEWYRLSWSVAVRCCSPVRFLDGSKVKLVAKELDECGDGEMTVDELPQADSEAIQQAFTDMTQEAGRKARPFPEQPQVASDDPSVVESIPLPPVTAPTGTS